MATKFDEVISVFGDPQQSGLNKDPAAPMPNPVASKPLASGVDYLVMYCGQVGTNTGAAGRRGQLRFVAGTELAFVQSHRSPLTSTDPGDMHNGPRCQGYTIVTGDGVSPMNFQTAVGSGDEITNEWYAGALAAIAIPLTGFVEGDDYFKDVTNGTTLQLENAPTGSFSDVVSATFTIPDDGDYLVLMSCEGAYHSSSGANAMQMRFEVDSVDIAEVDAGGGEGFQIQAHDSTAQHFHGWAWAQLETLTAGSHTFRIRGSSRGSATSDFRRGRIIVLRAKSFGTMVQGQNAKRDNYTGTTYKRGENPTVTATPTTRGQYALLASISTMHDTAADLPLYRLFNFNTSDMAREDTGSTFVDVGFDTASDIIPNTMLHYVPKTPESSVTWNVQRKTQITAGIMRSGVTADGASKGRSNLIFWDLALSPAQSVLEDQAKARQAESIGNYLPTGRAFDAKNTTAKSIMRRLLEGLAGELLRADDLVQEFRDEILPDETVLFLDEWESALGIPDDCFTGVGTNAERRRDILAKLVSLGVQTAADFVALAALFGITATIKGGSVHGVFPYEFPMIFFPDSRTAFHTIVVDLVGGGATTFTYQFPITFDTAELGLVECLFKKLKPAHVDVLFIDLP